MAKILGFTKQNISLYTSELSDNELSDLSRVFSVMQNEGARLIKRDLLHYNVRMLAAIATRARRYDLHKEIVRETALYKVVVDDIPVRTRREWAFGKLLLGTLDGITPVFVQHRLGSYYADFFLPDLHLVVEYDEPHHEKAKQRELDNARQSNIHNEFGLSVLRVSQDSEVQGLNEIVRMIILKARNE